MVKIMYTEKDLIGFKCKDIVIDTCAQWCSQITTCMVDL